MKQTIGLIGCAHIHTPDFVKRINKRSDVAVQYVWDHDISRAHRVADVLNAAVAEHLNTILMSDAIQSVVICSETNLHYELVLAAAEAGKNIFVEKPLGITAKNAYKMARTIQETGVKFQTGFFQRSLSTNLFLKDAIAKGHFGKITRIKHSNCHNGSLERWFDLEWRWMFDPELAGFGAFGDMGAHSLDLLLWLLDEKVERVTANIQNVTGHYEGCDEFGEGLLHFTSGTLGMISAGWVDVANPITMEIRGTEGHAYVLDGKLFIKSKHIDGADGKKEWKKLPQDLPHALELFFDAAGGKDVPLITAADAAYGSAIMEALYLGAKAHAWVMPEKV